MYVNIFKMTIFNIISLPCEILMYSIYFFNVAHFLLRMLALIILAFIVFVASALSGFIYTNCWIYSINNYIVKGGYIIFTVTNWSKFKWFPWEHATWSPDLKVIYNIVPTKKKHSRILPPLLFKGREVLKYIK